MINDQLTNWYKTMKCNANILIAVKLTGTKFYEKLKILFLYYHGNDSVNVNLQYKIGCSGGFLSKGSQNLIFCPGWVHLCSENVTIKKSFLYSPLAKMPISPNTMMWKKFLLRVVMAAGWGCLQQWCDLQGLGGEVTIVGSQTRQWSYWSGC